MPPSLDELFNKLLDVIEKMMKIDKESQKEIAALKVRVEKLEEVAKQQREDSK